MYVILCFSSNSLLGAKQMKKILYIPIETKVRELPSKLLLSYFALKRGFSIVIGKKVVQKLVHSGASGIYLMKSGHSDLDHLNRDDLVVMINDAEGIVFADKTKFVERSRPISNIDHICTAGPLQKDIYLQYLGNQTKPKIHLIGEPRFDLFIQEFLDKYSRFSNLKQIKNKMPYILLPTAFSLVNPTPNYDKELLQSRYHKNFISSSEDLLTEYVKLVDKLSNRFPHLNLIIRPHPSENTKFWVDKFKKYPNVHITQHHSSMYWIYHSEVVIFNQSTIGLESLLLKKSAINFQPGEDFVSDFVITKHIGKIADSIDQVIDYIEQELVEPGILLDYENEIKKISEYLSIESKLSVQRLLDVITEEYEDKFNIKEQSVSRYSIKLFHKAKINLYELIYKLDFLIEKYFSFRPLFHISSKVQKFPGLSEIEIKRYFKIFDELYGESLGGKRIIKKIAPSTFFISSLK